MNMSLDIEGLNIKKGISMSGGDIELYIDALYAFCTDAGEKIDEIEDSLKSGDLPLYATYVHGLKSAAAIIGADELSEAAKALEAAGKSEDSAYIEANNAGFLSALNSMLDSIKKALCGVKKDSHFDDKRFKANLSALRTALDILDARAMNGIVRELQQSAGADEVVNEAVRRISDNILMGEYDETVALIKELLARSPEPH